MGGGGGGGEVERLNIKCGATQILLCIWPALMYML